MSGLIGRKIGMTSLFDENGKNIPCTVIEAGPCVVTQVRTEEVDGYNALQLGFDDKKAKSSNKALDGHFKKAGTTAKRKVIEFQGDPLGKITADLYGNGKPFHSISINPLKDAFDNATVFPITDQEALIDLAKSSLANKTITLNASGQYESAQPMGFKIQFTNNESVQNQCRSSRLKGRSVTF